MKIEMIKIIYSLLWILNLGYAQCISLPDDINNPVIPESISLSGYLITEKEWSRPNYGENPVTDSQFTALLLKLDAPLTICNARPDDKPLDCIQVINFCPEASSLFKYKFQHVTLEGSLDVAMAPGQVTQLTLNCTKAHIGKKIFLSTKELKSLKDYRCQSAEFADRRVNEKQNYIFSPTEWFFQNFN